MKSLKKSLGIHARKTTLLPSQPQGGSLFTGLLQQNLWICMTVMSALLILTGCGSKTVVPTTFKLFRDKEKSFKIEYPDGWTSEGGGRSGYAWAKFTSGKAEIIVDSSICNALLGDTVQTGLLPSSDSGLSLDDLKAVAMVHESERAKFEEESGFKEKKPIVVRTGMGEGRLSAFTGSSTFGSPITGYRLTTLNIQNRVRVVCQCPTSEWNNLQPHFEKILVSLDLGR